MFKFNKNNYLNNIAQNPNDMWVSLNQATINDMWKDTTQIRQIKEQVAYPFKDEYNTYEGWVSTISDDLINTSKVYSDFVRILFKDVKHRQNYKGQYYKLALDNEHEETYICYDRMGTTTQVSDFKCVRCNNVLTWIDKYKNIVTIPCYLGTDITSTNNLISKDGIISNARMIILVQANEFTKSIVNNQRFLFQNSTAFKVEEVNNYMREEGTNGEVTCVKIYISYSPILPSDNKELNICDYYNINYELKIDQEEINQIKGFNGKLTATLKNNGEVSVLPLIWKSNDTSVVRIDNEGNYSIIGNDGSSAIITCYMENNKDIKDTIKINVVKTTSGNKTIVVNPNDITLLRENQSVDFICGVYMDNEIQADNVDCVASDVDIGCYELIPITDGYRLTIKKKSSTPLKLTFSATGCTDYVISIKLRGLI